MVAAKAVTGSNTPPNSRIEFTDKNGVLTSTGLSILQAMHQTINGLTPTISCNCANVGNVYTLTPLSISPKVLGYFSFMSFAFVASATSTGLITATVAPATGTLPTIPVYKSTGQATTNDLLIGTFYVLYYVDTYNTNAGGFALK